MHTLNFRTSFFDGTKRIPNDPFVLPDTKTYTPPSKVLVTVGFRRPSRHFVDPDAWVCCQWVLRLSKGFVLALPSVRTVNFVSNRGSWRRVQPRSPCRNFVTVVRWVNLDGKRLSTVGGTRTVLEDKGRGRHEVLVLTLPPNPGTPTPGDLKVKRRRNGSSPLSFYGTGIPDTSKTNLQRRWFSLLKLSRKTLFRTQSSRQLLKGDLLCPSPTEKRTSIEV